MKLATNKTFPKSLLTGLVVLVVVGTIGLVNGRSRAASVPPAAAPAGSSFDQRLAQRKAEQNLQLDDKTIKHIQQQCVNAQSIIRALKRNTNTMISNRNDTYKNIDAVLWVNIGQLKLANQSTFTLEQDRADLYQKMLDFQSTAAQYQQSLDDLLVINCQADAVGFQSLLETSRAYYAQLISQKTDIYNYIVNNVKPTLESFIEPLLQRDVESGN